MSLGFEQAGFDIAAAVELDPIHCATHKYNFQNSKTICSSVSAVSGAYILDQVGANIGDVDCVFGGSPCQGFSMIGKRSLDDPRNELVSHFVRLVDELKPKYFVFENVRGLTLGKQRHFLDEIIGAFKGYRIALPWRVLNACDFGVPQNRQRLFLIGTKSDQEPAEYPTPAEESDGRAPTVSDAIGDLPNADDFQILAEQDTATVEYLPASPYASILRGLTKDKLDFSYRRNYDPELLTSSLRTSHSQKSRSRFKATIGGKTEPVSRYYKLSLSGISNTLRAGTASDRGAYTSPRPIHPIYDRCVTVREMARLHSFPDWFRFHVTKWHGARQIGNAVPPMLARAIAARVIASMKISPKKPRKMIQCGNEELLKMNMKEASEYFGVERNVIPQRIRRIETVAAE